MKYHQPPTEPYITAHFPNPKAAPLDPSNISIIPHEHRISTPETIDDALSIQHTPPSSYKCKRIPRTSNASHPRPPLNPSPSSDWWMEIRKSPTPEHPVPRSRKTAFATIVTDATESQPAFESDAFAIQMPTTREPIVDRAMGFRTKLPKPDAQQVEAYRRYEEKARRKVEEEYRNEYHVQQTRTPSYGYNGYRTPNEQEDGKYLYLDAAPAGAFPASPPLVQHGFSTTSKRHDTTGRSISESSHHHLPTSTPRRPVGLPSNIRITRHPYQSDVQGGATTTTSPTIPAKEKIKVHIKPRGTPIAVPSVLDPPQKESWFGLYNRSTSPQSTATATSGGASSTASSTTSSTPPSSVSTSPRKGYTYASSTPTKPIYAYTSSTHPTPTSSEKISKTAKKKSPEKKTLLSWLRPAGPRIHKPTTTTTTKTLTKPYISPFPPSTTPNTPTPSRSPSPKKLHRPLLPTAPSPSSRFDTSLSQIKRSCILILKICLVLYLLVGLYFVLDAIREAVHVLGAPVRGVKRGVCAVWVGGKWVFDVGRKVWERWGVRVKFVGRGGWW